jgi:hypothetical protein
MADIAALYGQLDPGRALEADDDALYVDWQAELDGEGEDTKARLIRTFVRNASPEHPITRFLTGHLGSGKTTELNRLTSRLEDGSGGKKVFVSKLLAQRWLDLGDLQPEDLVFQMVRQLVADLREAGIDLGERKLDSFFRALVERFGNLKLESAEIKLDPLSFSFSLEDFPTARTEFRSVLRPQLPTVFDLVNKDLLPDARSKLREQHGYDDLLLVVDDLDKIEQRVLTERGLTNLENLFLENAKTLRALNCSLLLTVPVELAYSPARNGLRNTYGAEIVTVPLVPIVGRDGTRLAPGEAALVDVLARRAQRAFGGANATACAEQIFADRELLLRVVRLSGGHVRSLLVIMSELLDRVDALPIGAETVDRYVPRAGRDLARGLFESDKTILRAVEASGEPVEDTRFFDLLKHLYVFAYEAGSDDDWYGLNPLLQDVTL